MHEKEIIIIRFKNRKTNNININKNVNKKNTKNKIPIKRDEYVYSIEFCTSRKRYKVTRNVFNRFCRYMKKNYMEY